MDQQGDTTTPVSVIPDFHTAGRLASKHFDAKRIMGLCAAMADIILKDHSGIAEGVENQDLNLINDLSRLAALNGLPPADMTEKSFEQLTHIELGLHAFTQFNKGAQELVMQYSQQISDARQKQEDLINQKHAGKAGAAQASPDNPGKPLSQDTAKQIGKLNKKDKTRYNDLEDRINELEETIDRAAEMTYAATWLAVICEDSAGFIRTDLINANPDELPPPNDSTTPDLPVVSYFRPAAGIIGSSCLLNAAAGEILTDTATTKIARSKRFKHLHDQSVMTSQFGLNALHRLGKNDINAIYTELCEFADSLLNLAERGGNGQAGMFVQNIKAYMRSYSTLETDTELKTSPGQTGGVVVRLAERRAAGTAPVRKRPPGSEPA